MARTPWCARRGSAIGLGAFLMMSALGWVPARAQEELYVANFNGNSVTVYPRTGNGDEPPLRTLLGGNTGLTGPVVVVVDNIHDELIVPSPGGLGLPSILVYPRGASGDTPPLRRIQGPSTGLAGPVDVALDPIRDELVVVNSASPGSITVYPRTGNGDVAPLRTISGPAAGFSLIQGVVIDLIHGELFVGDVGAKIHVFARTASGNVPPLRILAGPHTTLTSPLTAILDLVRDEMWVVDGGSNSLKVYARTAEGDTPPLRIIQGANTRLAGPLDGLLNLVNDELMVVNSAANSITVYPRTAFGDVGPAREIVGNTTGLNNAQGLAVVTTAPLVGAVLPTSRSVQRDTPATAFATMINAAVGPAQMCFPVPITPVPAVFSFQVTDAQNVPVGILNTPANLSPGGSQSFVLVFQPTDAFPPTLIEIGFSCDAVNRAQTIVGVSTLLLSASTGAVADVIALAATVGNNGIVDVPGANGAGAFAVATSNVGQASALITVTADTGAKTLPVTLLVCQTNPATSACLAPPASSVSVTIAPGATPTFSVFAIGLGVIDFDPASNRVIVHFTEGSTERGATTVAIRTVQPTP